MVVLSMPRATKLGTCLRPPTFILRALRLLRRRADTSSGCPARLVSDSPGLPCGRRDEAIGQVNTLPPAAACDIRDSAKRKWRDH
jgi:hypothetical protein